MPSEITKDEWVHAWDCFKQRRDKSRSATDVEPAPVVFKSLTLPEIAPAWRKCHIWLATGRGPIGPKYADDIREILTENSIKDMR